MQDESECAAGAVDAAARTGLVVAACEIFDGLVSTLDEMGIASSADTAVIAMAASRLEEVEITTALVEDNGRTYETTTESGGTTLAGGTLRVENNTALGVRTTGSVLDYADGITLHNPIVIDSNTTQLQVLAGSAAQAGAITELNGPRPLEKIGAGELRLWTVNMYSGGTRVSQGFLSANVTGALGTGPVTIKLQAPLASFLRGQRAPKHCRPTLRMLAACWDLWIMHLPATRRSSTVAASDSRKTPALTVPRS